MHHFLYSTQDAFISNKSDEKNKNFGIDELLVLGVSHSYSKVINDTKTYQYTNVFVSGMQFQDFTGTLNGSVTGVTNQSYGIISGSSTRFTSSYFSGSVSGSLTGYETGSSAIYTNFNGTINGFSGSINSVSIYGNVSGSLVTDCFVGFTGQLSGSSGSISGYISGNEIKSEQNITVVDRQYINRSLIKFDLSFISQSIVSGDVVSPKFYLKLKSTEARELPTDYKIYAFPLSADWKQGDGYWSDGGSDDGVSWNWKDSNGSQPWFLPTTETIITSSINYLDNYGYASESFKRGGGVWYNIPCTQSFSYQSSDVNLDVTNIVNSWLTNSIPNNGLILLYSGEVNISSSNAHLFFFGKETNTIYSPKLDMVWDDSTWVTGSFGTGSVTITSLNPKISGSISSGVIISNVSVSGSFYGNAYLVSSPDGVIDSGSTVNITGMSDTIRGININGTILGTSSYDVYGNMLITASFDTGDFIGSQLYAKYSSSMVTGFLTGSFTEFPFLNYNILGDVKTNHVFVKSPDQNSIFSGSMLGQVISGSLTGGNFHGVVTSGLLKGATVNLPFTGSYSYVTSSLSFTSSVNITGSALNTLDTSKPFVVIIQDLKDTYSFGDIPRIGVFGRQRFPLKSFEKSTQQVNYITPKVLPQSSYYAIKDDETEEIIFGFDNYTKISCDETGNYFHIDTTSLEQERYYRVLVKVDDTNGNTYTFDSGDLFKIRR